MRPNLPIGLGGLMAIRTDASRSGLDHIEKLPTADRVNYQNNQKQRDDPHKEHIELLS